MADCGGTLRQLELLALEVLAAEAVVAFAVVEVDYQGLAAAVVEGRPDLAAVAVAASWLAGAQLVLSFVRHIVEN